MPIIASVAVGQSIVRVRCSGLDRDPYIEKNIRLVDCSELSVEDNSGGPWDTHIWSIPRETLLSYAVGQPYVEPVVEVAPAPATEPVVIEVDPVVEAEARRRREELREADRMMLEMARERIAARKQRLEEAEKPAKRRRRKPQPVPQAPKRVEPIAEE